jgi:tRNA(Ile)-lysidine synthase
MAATKTPKRRPDPEADALPAFSVAPQGPFAVALSAGADSTALLRACALRWPQWVHAIHVNHGMQAAASDFEWHAQHLCQRWQVPLRVMSENVQVKAGQSPEEAARTVRYQALAQGARTGFGRVLRQVWLAQHADDQAESVLLAWSRGAGLSGLAAMPDELVRHEVQFVRPWLEVSGDELRSTLQDLGIPYIEDPSNQSEAYTRNRIRAQVLPVLERHLPGSKHTLLRTARHAAQAMHLLRDLAELDAALVGLPPAIAALQQLPTHRQANLLRHWLSQWGTQAQESQLQELLRQVQACRTRGHRIQLKVGAGVVQRQGAHLSWLQSRV